MINNTESNQYEFIYLLWPIDFISEFNREKKFLHWVQFEDKTEVAESLSDQVFDGKAFAKYAKKLQIKSV
jgi:hypothetical protein